MDNKNEDKAGQTNRKFRFSLLQVMSIVLLVIITSVLLTAWWVKHYIYASKFTPTVLTAQEQQILDSKLVTLKESAKKDGAVTNKKRSGQGAPSNRKPILKKA